MEIPKKVSKKEEKKIYETIVEEQPYCQLCGSTQWLAVHHIRYGAEGRHTYFGNVIRLCKNCHDKVHSNKKYWQPILIEMADNHEINMGRND